MKKGIMMASGLAGLLLGTVFTGAVMGEEIKAPGPDERGCIVRNGAGYKWDANIDRDTTDSPFYAADLKSEKALIGPIKKDRNSNRITEIGVIGIYKKDPSCDPK